MSNSKSEEKPSEWIKKGSGYVGTEVLPCGCDCLDTEGGATAVSMLAKQIVKETAILKPMMQSHRPPSLLSSLP